MDVGALLKQAREEALLTQRQLAAQLGLPSSTLSRYESGARQPSLSMLDRILAGCGKQLQSNLVRRHADLDEVLAGLAARSHADRMYEIDILTGTFLRDLAGIVVVGGAWAAALHGLPVEHKRGRLWIADDDSSLDAFAARMKPVSAWLYLDGQPSSPSVTPALLRRHPTAAWGLNCMGPCDTVLVRPGEPWPVEVRVDGDLGPQRAVPADQLGRDDGVRPEVLARWSRRWA